VAVLITGALSRYVNNIPADQPPTKEEKALLRGVRTNLKLAINYSIAIEETSLLSSYLQVVVMSEGDKWVRATAQNVALALRAGKRGRPVETARSSIVSFATAELRSLDKSASIAGVDDYISNAGADLVLIGLWEIVRDACGGDELPVYQFARDDRLYKCVRRPLALLGSHAHLIVEDLRGPDRSSFSRQSVPQGVQIDSGPDPDLSRGPQHAGHLAPAEAGAAQGGAGRMRTGRSVRTAWKHCTTVEDKLCSTTHCMSLLDGSCMTMSLFQPGLGGTY
jgi:hypothetical protein